MKKTVCILFLALSLILVFACSQPNTSPQTPVEPETPKVFSPTFIDIVIQTERAIELNKDNHMIMGRPFLYFSSTPVISKFENRSIASGDTYSSVFFDRSVPIRYEKQEDGKSLFSGTSTENDIYTSTLFSPDTNTYDYKQAIVAHSTAAGGWTDRIDITKGENISIGENGNSQGTIRHYFINVYRNGGKELGIWDGEFFSNELISGAVLIGGFNCGSSQSVGGLGAIRDARVADLNPTLDGIDEIIALGDELYERHKGTKPTTNHYTTFLYYDKKADEIKLLGTDENGTCTKEYPTKADAQTDATIISGGEWTLF